MNMKRPYEGCIEKAICKPRREFSGETKPVNSLILRLLVSETIRNKFWLFKPPSVQFSCSVVTNNLWPQGMQYADLPCQFPAPGAFSNSCPLSWWCHPTVSSSVVPFSSCLHSFPALGSFPMSQFFASSGQSIGLQLQHQFFQWIFRTDFL